MWTNFQNILVIYNYFKSCLVFILSYGFSKIFENVIEGYHNLFLWPYKNIEIPCFFFIFLLRVKVQVLMKCLYHFPICMDNLCLALKKKGHTFETNNMDNFVANN